MLRRPTRISGDADVASQGEAMYGGHGTLWAGPVSLMRALRAVLSTEARLNAVEVWRVSRSNSVPPEWSPSGQRAG
jgi:hypothetical protein